jgi:hypothetical protein
MEKYIGEIQNTSHVDAQVAHARTSTLESNGELQGC